MLRRRSGEVRSEGLRDLAPEWRAAVGRELTRVRSRVNRISSALARTYGTPDLGNKRDPLDECVFILLTFQTDIPRAQLVWRRFKARFPSWKSVLEADRRTIASVLRPAGFQRQRARLLQQLVRAVVERFGEPSLRPLRWLSTEEAEQELCALPGVDLKAARCVLMYALGREVFPVDSNAFRFFQRFGIVRPAARYRRRHLHDALQQLVSPANRLALHVNLVVHGRETCGPVSPNCTGCPVRRGCATGRRVK